MKIDVLGVKIDSLTKEQALNKAVDFFAPDVRQPLAGNSNNQHQIITANPEIVVAAWQDRKYQGLINSTSMVTADGIGLLWAAKFLTLKSNSMFASIIQVIVSGLSLIVSPNYCKEVLPERIAGVDLMQKICEQSKNQKIFLLGGEKGIVEKTAEALKKKYINLNIVGSESGPTFEDTSYKIQDTKKLQDTRNKFQTVIDSINDVKPDILFVAFGSPKQDIWINEYLPKMPSVKLSMGVGGAFDFISGDVKRAPQIWRDLNIEWLYRMFNEPWRLPRIFNATFKFIFSVVKYKHHLN